ncbi:MAG: rhomboid family intramembrane serine protease [Armatimonadetes bacterium]|jgi:membrane associated rhomboid family serine protease|nr:rhomboid family intramembrane serine protease [Armatimonadota bacterium]
MLPLHDNVPSRHRPWVVYALIATNVLVFFYTLLLGPAGARQFVSALGVTPADFSGGVPAPRDYVTLFTALFLHGGWLHLIVNLWYLWIFGDNVEDRMGHARFLAFYLLGGVAASFAHILLNWGSPVPSIGASGSIAAVLGAYLLLFPRARIVTLVPLIFIFAVQLPAVVVLGAWFVLQLWSGLGTLAFGAASGIAYWAHIGGFVFGLLAVPFFVQRRRRLPLARPRESWGPT